MAQDLLSSFNLQSRIAELAKGDAGHVILAFAIVDQLLETLLLAYLPKIADERAVLLFAHRRPLGSFAAKKKLAFALDLIDGETLADLTGIQKVRNAFAHPRGFLRFTSPEVAEVFKQAKAWPRHDNLRVLFDQRVTRTAKAIDEKFQSLLYRQAVAI
jgi:DNA-binding MltR family transcriptional regulator